MWAARYSTDIEADLRRGYSYAGWDLTPRPTPEQAWAEWAVNTPCPRCGCWWGDHADTQGGLGCCACRWTADQALAAIVDVAERQGYHVAPSPEGEGYMVALPGLSAYSGADPEDAADRARRDPRWHGLDIPLWVFEARLVMDDPDADIEGSGLVVVEPVGPAIAAPAERE